MRKSVLVLLLACCGPFFLQPSGNLAFAYQQPSTGSSLEGSALVKGNVLDADTREPIAFATVVLVHPGTGRQVKGTMTDNEGRFALNNVGLGEYILQVSFLGYRQQTVPVEVTADSKEVSVGPLALALNATELGEVTIKALRPSVMVEADKIVVSVEGTALAAGSTAYEVLERSPGVWLDQEGNIQLNGKAGVRVMIDGRPSYLTGKELQSMLEAMSAENVKSIEVITNPSAKYEAAGSSGLINIRLKQNTSLGMNGSVYAGYQYNKASGYSVGANLNYKKGGWNSYMSADMAERPRLREGVMIREFHENGANARFHQLRNEKMTMQTPMLRLGTDYELNERHSLGASASLSYSDTDRQFLSDSYLDDEQKGEHVFVKAGNFNDVKHTSGAFNLHYSGLLDSLGTNLSANVDYIKLSNGTDARYENRYVDMGSDAKAEELLRTHNPGYYDIYSAKVDFERRLLAKGKLELGVKASHVVSGNELDFYIVTNEREQLDKERSNHYRYTERIFAGYVNFNVGIGEKWTLQAGLRGEQTSGKGKPVGEGEAIKKRYFDLFPSFFLTQKVSEHYQVTYNYSRRVDRPNYRALNPFIFYLDPYSWAEGNPDLRPQYTNSFQVTQTLNSTYSLMLGYAQTKDFFAEVPEQRSEDNTTVYKERNIDKAENFSATLIAPVKIFPSWEVSNNIVAGHQNNRLLLKDKVIENQQFIFTAQSSHHVLLPLGLSLQASANYSSPSTYGIYRFKAQWWLDAGLKRSFLNEKLDVTLGGTDIFRTREIQGDASYHGNTFSFVNYFMARSIKIDLRYNFQRGQDFKMKSRKSHLEELNRAGGQ
ncbi:outer membrane receptor protein involved in Fe transport [Pontibacter ummariensis]|uniref:Outer membrane receptor proteins, mostly Fe transport n=1 Tax=Pontibacter ummariensis TaxID=1610492 RepID=A0A239IWK9_9BACT|nr:outer membrane beta-barrel protein [Pontibacter ummariensis]PRY08999.1 outer membrane receptor protein involved in Fe transport [Pontibacter ummariensis]SNS98010.1 Outer membrane receptor proteins, mostly Fe transport [Pontibacter ummariensis]